MSKLRSSSLRIPYKRPRIMLMASDLPNNPDVAYHLTWALAEDGESVWARDILDKSILDHPTFNERDDAETLLQQFSS
jgi:hypothetical protein